MRKSIYLFLVLALSLSITACDRNDLSNKAIEQGKLALANSDYDKALSSIELALNEGTNDVEARTIYDIIRKYNEAREYLKKDEFEKALQSLDEINSDYTLYAIKKDIDILRKEIDEKESGKTDKEDKEVEEVEKEDTSEKKEEVQKKEVVKAKEPTEKPKEKTQTLVEKEVPKQVKSRRDEYIRKMDDIEQKYSAMSNIYNTGSNAEIYEAEYAMYASWDGLINEIWSVIKTQYESSEMDEIVKIQRQWIKNKEKTAEENEREYGEDGIVYISTLAELTRQRCYELVELYMK